MKTQANTDIWRDTHRLTDTNRHSHSHTFVHGTQIDTGKGKGSLQLCSPKLYSGGQRYENKNKKSWMIYFG